MSNVTSGRAKGLTDAMRSRWGALKRCRHDIQSCALGPERLGMHLHACPPHSTSSRLWQVRQSVHQLQLVSKQGHLTGMWWGSYQSGGSIFISVEKDKRNGSVRKELV